MVIRLLLQAVGTVWYLRAVCRLFATGNAVMKGVGGYGLRGLWEALGWVSVAVAGAGLIFLHSWARKLGIVVLIACAVVVFGTSLLMRHSFDPTGYLVMALIAGGLILQAILLVAGKQVTNEGISGNSRSRMAILLVSTVAALIPIAPINAGTPKPLPSYPATANGELDFLCQNNTWRMVEAVPVASEGRKIQTRPGAEFVLKVTRRNSMVELMGVPSIDTRVAVDLSRNVLLLGEWTLPGIPMKGNSPIADGASFSGVRFRGTSRGAVSGSVGLFELADGRLLFGFDALTFYGKRFQEVWIGAPVPGAENPAAGSGMRRIATGGTRG